jgi:hypothetical protein
MTSSDWRNGPWAERRQHLLETGQGSDCRFVVGSEGDTKVNLYFKKVIIICFFYHYYYFEFFNSYYTQMK